MEWGTRLSTLCSYVTLPVSHVCWLGQVGYSLDPTLLLYLRRRYFGVVGTSPPASILRLFLVFSCGMSTTLLMGSILPCCTSTSLVCSVGSREVRQGRVRSDPWADHTDGSGYTRDREVDPISATSWIHAVAESAPFPMRWGAGCGSTGVSYVYPRAHVVG